MITFLSTCTLQRQDMNRAGRLPVSVHSRCVCLPVDLVCNWFVISCCCCMTTPIGVSFNHSCPINWQIDCRDALNLNFWLINFIAKLASNNFLNLNDMNDRPLMFQRIGSSCSSLKSVLKESCKIDSLFKAPRTTDKVPVTAVRLQIHNCIYRLIPCIPEGDIEGSMCLSVELSQTFSILLVARSIDFSGKFECPLFEPWVSWILDFFFVLNWATRHPHSQSCELTRWAWPLGFGI